MKKLMMLAACMAVAAGCQTRVTATKFPETAHPLCTVVQIDGKGQVITNGYLITSGGWEATARSPLYADEVLKGLDLGVMTNGTVYFRLDTYHRDLSTNAVVMVKTIFDGSVNLVNAAAKAYAMIQTAGGTTAAEIVGKKIADYFKSKGGKEASSTVTVDDETKTLTVTDGNVCISCDASGNCTDCTDCVGGVCTDK